MSLKTPLAAFFLLAMATASDALSSTIDWSQTSTRDSALTVSGKLDPGVRGVWVHIQKTGETHAEELYPEIVDGRFSQKIFLREGRGSYQVSVRETPEAPKRVRTFYEIVQVEVQNLDPQDRRFLLPSAKVQSQHPEIVKLAREITAGHATPESRSKRIHDWIATNIEYDAARRLAGQNSEKTALQALFSRKAFCNGYAHLNAALHRAAGIPARVVLGWGMQGKARELHEWNEVLVGGNWKPQDVTWDAGGISPLTRKFAFALSARYFLTPWNIFARDHRKIKIMRNE